MEIQLRQFIRKILEESVIAPKDLKFVETSRGSHSGQHDLTAFAILNGITIGYVDYSIFQNEIHIEMVEVVDEYKRQGVGTKLFHFIRLQNSGMKIVPGYSTEEGSKFYQTYKSKWIKEDINVPINVGDQILGGKFKNKKITVKDIGKNEKGDITINKKPLLRFRIPNKSTDKK